MSDQIKRASDRETCVLEATLEIALPDETYSRSFPVSLNDISTLGAGVQIGDEEGNDDFLDIVENTSVGRLKIRHQRFYSNIYCKVVWVDKEARTLGLWFNDQSKDLDNDERFQALLKDIVEK
jgi:hypothetical protein